MTRRSWVAGVGGPARRSLVNLLGRTVGVGGLAALPLLLLLPRAGAQQQDPRDALLKARIEEYQRHFREMETERGAKPDMDRLAKDQCMRCHLGIDNPAYRIDESFRRLRREIDRDYVFFDQAVQKRFLDRFPQKRDRGRFARTLRAHPRLELYASAGSPHPISRFACMDCHGADDRKGQLPDDRQKAWTASYVMYHGGPFNPPFPMIQTKYAQASCRACHGQEAATLPGAEKFALGMRMVQLAACYACHEMPEHATLERYARKRPDGKPDPLAIEPKAGPPLTHIADKLDRHWTFNFFRDPESFRLSTRMPRFFPRGGDKAEQARVLTQEQAPLVAAAVVEYLFQISQTRKYARPPVAPPADEAEKDARIVRGRELVEQIGCTACHRTEELYSKDFIFGKYDKHLEEFGPNLAGLGDKFGSERGRTWLYYWLKDPSHYSNDTRMPSMRLTDPEIADTIEYLLSLRIDGNVRGPLLRDLERLVAERSPSPWNPVDPPLNIGPDGLSFADPSMEPFLDQVVQKFSPDGRVPDGMDAKQKVLWLGRRMVTFWGCYSCHQMSDRSLGTDDWPTKGPIGDPYSVQVIFPGRGRFERMPFSWDSVEEGEAYLTYLLSYWAMGRPEKKREPTARDRAILRGRRVLDTHNCGACHELQAPAVLVAADRDRAAWRDGILKSSDERSHTVHWLADPASLGLDAVQQQHASGVPAAALFDQRPGLGAGAHDCLKRFKERVLEIDYEHPGHLQVRLPPSLRGEGARVQAEWVRSFLKNPTEIRPVLRSRRVVASRWRGFADAAAEAALELSAANAKAPVEALARAAGEMADTPEREAVQALIEKHRKTAFAAPAVELAAAHELFQKARDAVSVTEHGVRMPAFTLRDDEIEALVAYFQAQGPPGPDAPAPDPATRLAELAPAMETITSTCNRCHLPGKDGWAPDLRNAGKRLRPAWLEAYVRNPLAWDAHSMMPEVRAKDEKEFRAIADAVRSYARLEELLRNK